MFGEFIAESSDPISINADMLEWAQRGDRDVLEYSGNVIATRGDMIIRASRLTVFLPAGGAAADVTFDRIEASGNVSIVAGPQTVAALTDGAYGLPQVYPDTQKRQRGQRPGSTRPWGPGAPTRQPKAVPMSVPATARRQ